MIHKQFIIAGKRKTAVAKVKVIPGTGKIFYNRLPSTELSLFHRLALVEPLRIYERELGELKHDLHISTLGGGKESQIEAARVGIARALIAITSSDTLKKSFMKYDRNMVVQDSRRKEARKPGDSKARAKRQKSYR
ncbi:30S ribosomal protein S9 [Candidatus Pacearchaeota archaeon]|nr:30S ribosomal protein S9 [Candidatus Pacearchaeota archaeon]